MVILCTETNERLFRRHGALAIEIEDTALADGSFPPIPPGECDSSPSAAKESGHGEAIFMENPRQPDWVKSDGCRQR